MEELWGAKQPAAGSTALRVRVSQLRKVLKAGGEDMLVTRPPGYALLVPRDGLDLWRFERALEEGERALRTDPQRALDALVRALAEWRGAPLVDVAHAPFAQAATVRLEELRASALELRIEAELALGRHATLIGELYALTGEHPLRERLSAQLMTALYRDGRQADALAAYRAARERLVEEIGIEPGPELKALEARILAQDPDLITQPSPTSRPTRIVLAVCTGSSAPAAVADRLAATSDGEAVAVGLMHAGGDLAGTTAQLRAAAPSARVAAFTTDDPAGDTIRLAAEQDAAILLLAAPSTPEIDERTATVLRAAACDVAMLAGDHLPGAGPVLVPFSGHSHDWAAAELGAWLGHGAVTLLGVRSRDGSRDASRLLASASLALQRGAGVRAETLSDRRRGDRHARGGDGSLGAGRRALGSLADRGSRQGQDPAPPRRAVPGAARAARHPSQRPGTTRGAHALHLVRRVLTRLVGIERALHRHYGGSETPLEASLHAHSHSDPRATTAPDCEAPTPARISSKAPAAKTQVPPPSLQVPNANCKDEPTDTHTPAPAVRPRRRPARSTSDLERHRQSGVDISALGDVLQRRTVRKPHYTMRVSCWWSGILTTSRTMGPCSNGRSEVRSLSGALGRWTAAPQRVRVVPDPT